MKRQLKIVAVIAFMLTAATSCTTDIDPTPMDISDAGSGSGNNDRSLITEFCNRADSCNILNGSVEECIELFDAALNPLPKSQRAEVELAIKECLAHPSCSGLQECIIQL
jgi:hypothetical protein